LSLYKTDDDDENEENNKKSNMREGGGGSGGNMRFPSLSCRDATLNPSRPSNI